MNRKEHLILGKEQDIAENVFPSETENCLRYLKDLAAENELKSEDGEPLLKKQYENLKFIETDNAMSVYLNPKKYVMKTYGAAEPIFPFGGNASQFKAVTNALTNQISIIQGPPGTGKTQTILNIIANLLVARKNVLVVSNNNSATMNVMEKLSDPAHALEFLVAPLGKKENKKSFADSQSGAYPALSDWELEIDRQPDLKTNIQKTAIALSAAFAMQERHHDLSHKAA